MKQSHNNFINFHIEKTDTFLFLYFYPQHKSCVLIASQAIRKHLVPFTEWNNEKTIPVLRKSLDKSVLSRIAQCVSITHTFQINYAVSFPH